MWPHSVAEEGKLEFPSAFCNVGRPCGSHGILKLRAHFFCHLVFLPPSMWLSWQAGPFHKEGESGRSACQTAIVSY